MKISGLKLARILLVTLGCLFLLCFILLIIGLIFGDGFDVTAAIIGAVIFLVPGVLLVRKAERMRTQIQIALAEKQSESALRAHNAQLASSGGWSAAAMSPQPQASQNAGAPQPVSCTGCGAKAAVSPGQAAQCEYCGTPLSLTPHSK